MALNNASYGHVVMTCPLYSTSSQSITTRPTGLKCGECHVTNNRLNENGVLSIMTLVGSFQVLKKNFCELSLSNNPYISKMGLFLTASKMLIVWHILTCISLQKLETWNIRYSGTVAKKKKNYKIH